MFSGNHFENKGLFGQFPLQVEGFKDIHESLEAATAQGEIETLTDDTTIKSGQEVRMAAISCGCKLNERLTDVVTVRRKARID